MADKAAGFPMTAMVWLEIPERIKRGGIHMNRFLVALLICAMLLFAVSMAEQSAPMLVSCVYSIYGGMENEDCTYTIRLDDSPETALLTLAKRDSFEVYSLPRKVLDDLAELMAAYNPADWSSLPEREEYALDAPERCIELVYADGSEYTLCNDRETGGPIFADTESLLMGNLDEGFDAESNADAVAGTYRYESEGFGGDFTITLNPDGTCTFYEGPLSSYMGGGKWDVHDNIVYLTEVNGFDLKFVFTVQGGTLVYEAVDSDAFPYVKVDDAERFVREDPTP